MALPRDIENAASHIAVSIRDSEMLDLDFALHRCRYALEAARQYDQEDQRVARAVKGLERDEEVLERAVTRLVEQFEVSHALSLHGDPAKRYRLGQWEPPRVRGVA